VGGIDFGFRNPFAAVWGTLDRDDVLWLTDEHYVRGQPLSHHSARLPRDVHWYCDPSGAGERAELVRADFRLQAASNAVAIGIAAVAARLADGGLRIQQGCCPNLLAEAQLYRYADDRDRASEVPLPEHNHALDALRYLVHSLDARRLARPRPLPVPPVPAAAPRANESGSWRALRDPALDHLWDTFA
jgi:hypothetical protein